MFFGKLDILTCILFLLPESPQSPWQWAKFIAILFSDAISGFPLLNKTESNIRLCVALRFLSALFLSLHYCWYLLDEGIDWPQTKTKRYSLVDKHNMNLPLTPPTPALHCRVRATGGAWAEKHPGHSGVNMINLILTPQSSSHFSDGQDPSKLQREETGILKR